MEKIKYKFSLDVHKNGVQRTLQGFQTGDSVTRVLEIGLEEAGKTYEFPQNGVSAILYVSVPGEETPNFESCTIDGNTVICQLSSLSFAECGMHEAELRIRDAQNKVLVSPKFNIEVWESMINPQDEVEYPSYAALEQAVSEANRAYAGRITSISFDDDLVLTFNYGDSAEYSTTKIKEYLETVKASAKGDPGKNASISIVSVDYSNDEPEVTDSATTAEKAQGIAKLNFKIPKGDKGDTGDSGVYMGSTEPTDEEINVWIDTDATIDVMVSESTVRNMISTATSSLPTTTTVQSMINTATSSLPTTSTVQSMINTAIGDAIDGEY